MLEPDPYPLGLWARAMAALANNAEPEPQARMRKLE